MNEEKVKGKQGHIGAKRMFFWQSRAVSAGCNMLILGFLSIYCTDTLGISPALVGILLMASRIFDGVTDLFAGYIVDKTNTRWGRGRPYEWCIIGVWICTWLMFSCPPELSTAVKCAWVFIMYMFVTSIFTTFLNASDNVYMVRAFDRQEHYVAIKSYGSIIPMIFAVLINVSFPLAMGRLATSAAGWSTMLAVYAVPLALIGILRFLFIKETNEVDVKAAGEKIRMKDVFMVLKKNPYIYIIAFATLISNLITNMGVNVYYFTHIVKNVEAMSPLALVQILALPMMFAFPSLIKKFSTTKLIMTGLIFTCIGYAVNFFAYANIALLMVGGFLVNVGAVPLAMVLTLLILDCADYNEWKGMPRLEGTLSSVNGFAQKMGASFGAGIMGILLGSAGYDGVADVMPQSALSMVRLLYSIVPLVLYILVIVTLGFYRLEKQMPQIRRENEAARQRVKEEG